MSDRQTPHETLAWLADLYNAKSNEYGDAYLKFGKVMYGLMGERPLVLRDADDHLAYYLTQMMAQKLARHATNFDRGGHLDSLHDLSVYAAMLAAIVERRQNEEDDQ
jgi:hypothetical protein